MSNLVYEGLEDDLEKEVENVDLATSKQDMVEKTTSNHQQEPNIEGKYYGIMS